MNRTQDKVLVADSVLTMLEKLWEEKGVSITLEIIPTEPGKLPAAMLRSLTSDPVVKPYKSGDYIGEYRYEMYMRVAEEDTNGRLAQNTILLDIAEQAAQHKLELPKGFEFRRTLLTTNPTLRDATEQYETYFVTLVTEFKRNIR